MITLYRAANLYKNKVLYNFLGHVPEKYLQERKKFRCLVVILNLYIVHSLDADMAVSTAITKIITHKEDIFKGIAMLSCISHD